MFKETVSIDIFEIAEQRRKGLVQFIAREVRWPHDPFDKADPMMWKITGHTFGRIEITVRDMEQMVADGDLTN